ncbi:MAG TPA: GntR family transcriptional regulator [Microbacterium sp.]|uniref:GntR family transcriptional regulator n=1 Tax=Microbacterium sp. TaxID=51671 RepID=UPI002CFCEBB7|nr:GntR family transcriptional regulator [Microbacterium sp.]HWI32171.1 GntR family transcriptional regulator [Microbacterium sp.]
MTNSDVGPFVASELLSATVKRLLIDRIMDGQYKPGERIVELRLAKELGTSQSPIREALRDLAAIGIVTIHSRRGARVRRPTSKELSDVSLVRSEVDALAARIAAPAIDEHAVGMLKVAFDEMMASLEARDFMSLTQADARFHRIIVEASANNAIERVFDQLEPFARTFITLTLPNVDVRSIILEHHGIMTALADKDPELASARARDHQVHVSDLFRNHYVAEQIAPD